jgi:hypothetical protein
MAATARARVSAWIAAKALVDLQPEKGSCQVAECGSRASRVAAAFGVRAGRPGIPGGRRDFRPTQRQFFALDRKPG